MALSGGRSAQVLDACVVRARSLLFESSSSAWERLAGRLLNVVVFLRVLCFFLYVVFVYACVCDLRSIGEKRSLEQKKNLGDRSNCERVCGRDSMKA